MLWRCDFTNFFATFYNQARFPLDIGNWPWIPMNWIQWTLYMGWDTILDKYWRKKFVKSKHSNPQSMYNEHCTWIGQILSGNWNPRLLVSKWIQYLFFLLYLILYFPSHKKRSVSKSSCLCSMHGHSFRARRLKLCMWPLQTLGQVMVGMRPASAASEAVSLFQLLAPIRQSIL